MVHRASQLLQNIPLTDSLASEQRYRTVNLFCRACRLGTETVPGLDESSHPGIIRGRIFFPILTDTRSDKTMRRLQLLILAAFLLVVPGMVQAGPRIAVGIGI